MINRYTLGFMFDPQLQLVLLIKKEKPKWQAGLLNGIGGKVEGNERPISCMVREFAEETGMVTAEQDWREFLIMQGKEMSVGHTERSKDQFKVYCYHNIGPVEDAKTQTAEEIFGLRIDDKGRLYTGQKYLFNLNWIIPLAIDHRKSQNPYSTVAYYG